MKPATITKRCKYMSKDGKLCGKIIAQHNKSGFCSYHHRRNIKETNIHHKGICQEKAGDRVTSFKSFSNLNKNISAQEIIDSKPEKINWPQLHKLVDKDIQDTIKSGEWKLRKQLLMNPKIKMWVSPLQQTKLMEGLSHSRSLSEVLEENPDQKYYLSESSVEWLMKRAKMGRAKLSSQLIGKEEKEHT